MEKLMNRLVSSPTLLEDEKLNAKIERLFENNTFQRMVETTDVFHDISNMSFTNSFINKNVKLNDFFIMIINCFINPYRNRTLKVLFKLIKLRIAKKMMEFQISVKEEI